MVSGVNPALDILCSRTARNEYGIVCGVQVEDKVAAGFGSRYSKDVTSTEMEDSDIPVTGL